MTKIEQETGLELLHIIATASRQKEHDEAVEKLRAMFTKERHPEGSDHLLTGKSWQELDIMHGYAENGVEIGISAFIEPLMVIDAEIERRLLALIPKNQD